MREDRTRFLIEALEQAALDFVQKHQVNHDEYRAATDLLLESFSQGEGSLLFDVFVAAEAMDTINKDRPGSPDAIEGPFYIPGAPKLSRPYRMPMRPDEKGSKLYFKGRITDAAGAPIANAELDIWHADADGLYAQIHPGLPEWNFRARIYTDENGYYEVETILPPPYEIPKNGATGKVLDILGRHFFRPAHIHVKVRADGHRELTSQLYFEGGEYLDSDVARGVRDGLIARLTHFDAQQAKAARGTDEPFAELHYDFQLDA